MWNIFSNEDLSLHIEKREEESSEKKITKKKGLETESNKNGLTKSGSHGSPISNHNSKITNKAYEIKIKELRKNFRKKYRIVRTQLLKIIKIVKQFPEVDAEAEEEEKKKGSKAEKGQAEKDKVERDNVKGDKVERDNVKRDNVKRDNVDKGKGGKRKEEGKGTTNGTTPDDSNNQTIMVQAEFIKKLNKLIEKIDVEKLKTKKRIKGKQNNKGKNEGEGLKNKPGKQTFTSKPSVSSPKNDLHKSNINVVKKFPKKNIPPKSAKNFQYFSPQDMGENTGGMISLQNEQNSLKNEYFQNGGMNVYSKNNNEGNMYHATDDTVVTDFYMYSSTLNAGSIQKTKKSRWLGDNMNHAVTNYNGVYDGNGYNNFGGNNYGYWAGNYDYAGGSFNYNYGSYNYNGGNYANGSYNYETNNNAPFRAKGNHFAGNSNQEKGAANKSFFQNMASASYTQSFKGGVPQHYEPQNLQNVADGYQTQNRNKKRNMNNKKKGYKFAKDEKIRGLLRTATSENDLVKAIGFAKDAGLHFEAKLGSKKLNKLKLEGEEGASLEV
ncbi:Uncharacterized protein PCOAH_00010400 [Plasmodium coatneyi]|uniref:Uncharacterized protein n=1 Tax=Plasmodium coatneyi TaxID=208452 RepID=A0A1B1DW03_9APIC|nr:Uncharacterized protein PCOAH_00010400 [Plasmodium coatneyi]ANQ06829.1 Uncharacterized protein PCOAH_00010400 [Plasmodium coatneyi]